MKLGLVFILTIFFLLNAYAQQFSGFPVTTKWKQINSDTARIIFTPDAEQEAQRILSLIHKMASNSGQWGSQPNKINVVLHSKTTLANGYVQLAPFRSEFYLIPGGNIFEFGNLPWADQLAIHEYRHVQQYNSFNKGISKSLGFILGQEGRALGNALSVPDWFFEGDAVYAETIFTPQGRGRMPYFMNGFKSLWREGKDYTWMKLRNGSLKDYVPNHYNLGYLLVNYGYLQYGQDLWPKLTSDASAFKGLFYPFQKAIKTHTGKDYKTFRTEALEFYKHQVSKRRDDQTTPETVTNFYFPQLIGHDSLLYLKSSYKSLPAFYIKDKNGEHKIKLRHISTEDWFSYRNGRIAYTSLSVDPRWSLVNYNDIILLDIYSGEEKQITKKEKYYTPDISPTGESIAAIAINDSLQSELHILSLDGSITNIVRAPGKSFFINPKYIDQDNLIVGLRWPNSTISMETLNLESGKFEQLLPPSEATIGFPWVNNDTVYFVCSADANDDIYAFSLKNRKLFQLTTGHTGNYFPSVRDSQLVYSKFTTNGLHIQKQSLRAFTWTETTLKEFQQQLEPFRIAGDSATINLLEIPAKARPVSEYKKTTGLFDFHSWRPYYEDPEFSFSLYSDNILNTFSNELYYRYNQNEQSSSVGWNTSWGGWYPLINAGIKHSFKRELKDESGTIVRDQTEIYGGYSIPLRFVSGKTTKRLSFGQNIIYETAPTSVFKSDSLIKTRGYYLQNFLNFNQQLPVARLHIYPKFGYSLSLQYNNRIDEKGYQGLAMTNIYLPGIGSTHSVVLTAGFQQTDTNNIFLPNRFPNARGYLDYYLSRMWKVSGNYHFPLFYPDWGFANLIYFVRIRPNVFYDYSRLYSNNKQSYVNLRSIGTELMFDTKWWNQLPVSFGVRYSYLLDADKTRTKQHVFEFIVPVGLIPN